MGSLKTDGRGVETTVVGKRPRRSPLRRPLAAAAALAAVAHLPVISPHLREAPYMGILFVLLTAACLLLAVVALTFDVPAVYLAAATVCGLTVVGYVATRLVSFPQLADDVDNWLEPLGVLAVLAEVSVVALAAFALRGRSWGEAPPVA